MAITVYGIPNCNTVKKALTWLDQHGLAYQFHDFKKHGASNELLHSWLQQQPWEKLVNRAGMTWRNLSDAEKSQVIDAASALSLMHEKTSVIKRPIVVRDQLILALGFDETNYQQIFGDQS